MKLKQRPQFASLCVQYRQEANLTQRALANAAQTSRGNISSWESGAKPIGPTSARRLADGLRLRGIRRKDFLVAAATTTTVGRDLANAAAGWKSFRRVIERTLAQTGQRVSNLSELSLTTTEGRQMPLAFHSIDSTGKERISTQVATALNDMRGRGVGVVVLVANLDE